MHLNVLVAYLAIAALCLQFQYTSTRTSSTLWRLNPNNGKITAGGAKSENGKKNSATSKVRRDLENYATTADHAFNIIATVKENVGNRNGWIRQSPEKTTYYLFNRQDDSKTKINTTRKETKRDEISAAIANEKLNCGKPVNFTIYDNLPGIEQRHFYHPPIPEPEVAYLFLKTPDELAYHNFNIEALARKLKQMKYEQRNSMSFELYTNIGNYFRIIGDSREAIECFRHALAKRNHSKALRNLARVLFNLHYLSDAMRVSLESISLAPNDGYVPWEEYFILGEIFKVSGRTQESSFHLRRALELHPHHEPILRVLRDVENNVLSALHVHTLFIIIVLVLAVVVVIISSSVIRSDIFSFNGNNQNSNQFDGERSQKHFNRAMAMRSLKRHRRF